MSEAFQTLEDAIQAAQSGQREKAREILLGLVEKNPQDPLAWMWLGQVLDDPEDQAAALENAESLRATGQVIWALQRPEQPEPEQPDTGAIQNLINEAPIDIESLLMDSEHLISAGRYDEAVTVLNRAVGAAPENERAWLLLSEALPNSADKVQALARAAALNPSNMATARRLAQLRKVDDNPFQRAELLESRGEFEAAAEVYHLVTVHSRSATERVEAERRIDAIKLRLEADHLQQVHPNMNLARLTIGPVLLFALMVFLQSGLNPLHSPLPGLVGIVTVAAGSLLIAVTGMRPAHPIWVRFFGSPGSGEEPDMRKGLRLLGFGLLLAPYSMFLIEASHRLGVLQASMLR